MGSSPSLVSKVSNKNETSISIKSKSISLKKQNKLFNRNVNSNLKLDTQSTSTNITSPCDTPLLSKTNSSSNLNNENSYFYHMPLTPTPYSPKHTLPILPAIKSEEDFELIMQNQYGQTQTFKITPENYLLAHLNNRLHHNNNRSNQISRTSSISESDSNDVCCYSGRVSIPMTRNNSISSMFENDINICTNLSDYGFNIESIQEESYYCNLCNKTFNEEGLFFNHVEYSKIHHIAVLELRSRS
mmetsp:Transcript_8982/g.8019  ORF Transcript_8982/g.8019 Transcript_8982/m.8019 type:complete len:244 (+) Transcript_8982:46-777(+)